jgi:phenylpyruvate tautomerase PptA (4-oxalocrotonate tautomerase family)
MPVVTIKAKAGRDPAKIDRLIAEVRDATMRHLEVPREKVVVIYEEVAGNIYFESGDAPPEKMRRSGS